MQNNTTITIMENKICTKCGINKPLNEFHNSNKNKDGKTYWCAKCVCEKSRIYHQNNKEFIQKKSKIYRQNNKEYFNKKKKEWLVKTGYYSDYQKTRLKNDSFFKFKNRLRTLIRNSVTKQGYTKKSKSFQILGCEYDFFIKYIEDKFTNGMNWNNHGEWHLDHIVPISSAKTEEDVIKLNHYTNFQPLWAIDNLIKYNNQTYDQKQHIIDIMKADEDDGLYKTFDTDSDKKH